MLGSSFGDLFLRDVFQEHTSAKLRPRGCNLYQSSQTSGTNSVGRQESPVGTGKRTDGVGDGRTDGKISNKTKRNQGDQSKDRKRSILQEENPKISVTHPSKVKGPDKAHKGGCKTLKTRQAKTCFIL